MIFEREVNTRNANVFNVPVRVIWFSAMFMGILASIPKILQLHITFTEIFVDCLVAFIFSLGVWYYNIYSLPKFYNKRITTRFFSLRLLWSLLLGTLLMISLVILTQLAFSGLKPISMMLMYEFRGILINLTIYMFLHLLYQSYKNQLIGIELERSKADNLSAQYELLKQQVNPHFLFNSLNTLKSMVDMGDENSGDFILKLSDFYRFTLENRKENLIPLKEELAILDAYMYLLKARFEDGIQLETNISEAHLSSYAPPFTLQLLVENAIKHNVVSLEQPLLIRLYSDAGYLIIENPIAAKKNNEPSTQMGLENINQRYLHLLGKPISTDAGNNIFKVSLPVIYERIDH
jgi:two-component system LytT family sensor kinase